MNKMNARVKRREMMENKFDNIDVRRSIDYLNTANLLEKNIDNALTNIKTMDFLLREGNIMHPDICNFIADLEQLSFEISMHSSEILKNFLNLEGNLFYKWSK